MSECTAYKELEARIKELELRNTYLEQQEAQKQSRQLHINIENFMDTNFNAVAIINQKHRVVHANKKFAALLGYSQNEIYNLHTWDWESSMDGQKIPPRIFQSRNNEAYLLRPPSQKRWRSL